MIDPGSKVTFVRTKKSGSSFKMTVYEGKMIEYGTMFCRIGLKNGRVGWVQTDCVRKIGDPNALTEAVLEGLGVS